MPRYPSSRGVPAEHLLNEEDLEHERQARRFHREVNHERYLAWHTVARRIKPNQRYVVVSYGYIREALLGHEILDYYSQLVNARSCTYINELKPVPDDYQIPVEDLWAQVRRRKRPHGGAERRAGRVGPHLVHRDYT